MDAFINGMKRHAGAMDSARGQTRWGTVLSVNPAGPMVKLMLHPEEVQSGWLPVLQQSASASAGGFVPSIGDMACVMPDLGEANHGIVVGFAHNDLSQQPAAPSANGTGGTPSTTAAPRVAGEWVIVAFGSVIRATAAGAIYMKPGNGTVQIDGNLVCNGDVSDRHGSLDRLRMAYNAHKHPDPQGGLTGITDHVDPE